MSGEDYVHGINKMKKPATKVMAPPGGQTQINLFGAAEEPAPHRVNPAQAQRNQSNIFGGPEEQKPTPKPSAVAAPPPVATSNPSSASAPAAKGSITEPPKNPTAPDGGRASTKVMAPPGGKTSINLFG